MSRSARLLHRVLHASLALVTAVSAAQGQSLLDAEVRLAPQYVHYRLQAPADETISELAIPVFVVVPAGSRLTFDVGTAYSRALVTSGTTRSEISGLTDTQIRGSYTLGGDFVVLTAGVSLPTGQRSVTLEQLLAAGRIGNDFLAFPVSNMGTGLAGTGGLALALPLGEWSVGAAVSVRRSKAYEPFDVPGQSFRYQPGNEVRGRIGVDRPLAAGRLALGVTYAAFGREDAGGSAYNTGDRVIAQGSLTGLVGPHDYTIAAYNLFRAPGEYASGDRAGRENIANLFVSLGVQALGTLVEPSVELRHWRQHVFAVQGDETADVERTQSSRLATVGVRVRARVAGLTLYPSVGYTMLGRLAVEAEDGTPASADLTGFRLGLVARFAP